MKAGDAIETKRADWSFGGKVAENFISHVSRSVPGMRRPQYRLQAK